MKIKNGLKLAGLFMQEHAPEILTGVGIAGMITTVVMAVRATPKAVDELREKQPETLGEEIKIMAPHYIWTLVVGTASTFCLIESLSTSKRRNAGFAALVSMYENEILEYKDAAKEIVGEKKAQQIDDKVADNHAQEVLRTIDNDKYMIRTGRADTLTLDLITGQVFLSDIDWIKSRFIDMNDFLQQNETMDVSDYAYILQLEDPQLIGHALGWHYDRNNRIELSDTYTGRDGIPMLVIGHRNPPRYDFMGLR